MQKLMTGGKKKNINEALMDGETRKEPKVQTTIMMRRGMIRRLKTAAVERDSTMSDLVADALEKYLDEGQ
ncbi:hypothetical protein J3T92_07200 [Bifidobacterium sp. B4081]|uniref:hypothetical protein n=1 Tax=Bifidobacterium TaxID=1678 RepID=UPI001C695BC6|nr:MULTISPECIES: hypothetical protein [Bifidobacterium]MCX8644497.1 hypothetical protein [Bifidobacterium sp. B4077]MCX8646389.1 hypothetical protein [Bifidobacterium sp. B4081]MCX8648438.1 hypothetical protein [Bifidobacterium sp. B4107]MCX8652570.1 hypothetical protein [Bifidobacterium sp. B4111]MCX8659066.1 hypothetical protein [Bifidobacterium sp. B4114]